MLNQVTTNPNVQKAVTIIRELSSDEKIREEARKREEALFTERSALSSTYDKGVSDGIAKGIAKGMAKGMEKGRAEGMAKGRAEGRAELAAELAANLRAMGMSEEQIKIALNGQSLS